MKLTVAEIAAKIGQSYEGDGDVEISRVATLANADSQSISFLSNPSYLKDLKVSKAVAIILSDADKHEANSAAVIISDNPYLSYAQTAQLLYPRPLVEASIHPSAVVHEQAQIGAGVSIGATVVVEAGAVIASGVSIAAGSYVGKGVTIGVDTMLAPNVTLLEGVMLGARNIIHSGAVLGADGFGFANDRGSWVKIPQVGGVIIGDDVEIGACTTIDRGAIGDTKIGNGVKLDNHIQIGHNVTVGEHTAMVACAGIAGSTTVGAYCNIAGGVGIAGHLTIEDGTTITARSMVTHSLKKGVYSSGIPVQETGEFRKNAVRFRRLNELFKRVKKMENDS